MQEQTDSGRYSNCTHQAINTTGREWCNDLAKMEVQRLIDANARIGDVVVYIDGSVHRGGRPGWGVSVRIQEKERFCIASLVYVYPP